MGVKRGILGREGTLAREAARDPGGNAATLRVRQAQDDTGGVITRGARICEPEDCEATPSYEKSRRDFRELTVAEELLVIGGLRAMVRGLVEDFNRAAGDAVLYYTECLGFWVLFGKREDGSDRRIASGYADVESLAALVERLQKEDVAV